MLDPEYWRMEYVPQWKLLHTFKRACRCFQGHIQEQDHQLEKENRKGQFDLSHWHTFSESRSWLHWLACKPQHKKNWNGFHVQTQNQKLSGNTHLCMSSGKITNIVILWKAWWDFKILWHVSKWASSALGKSVAFVWPCVLVDEKMNEYFITFPLYGGWYYL